MAKIGIVTTWFDRGASYVSRAYKEILENAGYDVFIFARGGEKYAKGDPFWDSSSVFYSPHTVGTTSFDLNIFRDWIKKNKLDAILFNEQIDIIPVAEAKKMGIRTVGYIDYYKKETLGEFENYDLLFCNTKRHYSVFKKCHPNVVFAQWGTDPRVFKKNRNNAKDPIFFHSAGMGGVNLRKGTKETIEAFLSLVSSSKCKLIIHSQVPVSKYGEEIKNIVEKEKRIQFIESTEKPPGLFYLGNVYVYPTKLEGIGLTIPEAMATGLPVITTSSRPMTEFVKHNKNGRLVKIKERRIREDNYYWPECLVDIDSLSKQMQYYVDNKDKIVVHGDYARKMVEERFDFKLQSEKIINSFQLLLEGECEKKGLVARCLFRVNNFLGVK